MCKELTKETNQIWLGWIEKFKKPSEKLAKIKIPCSDFLRRASIVRVTSEDAMKDLVKAVEKGKCPFFHYCKSGERKSTCGNKSEEASTKFMKES